MINITFMKQVIVINILEFNNTKMWKLYNEIGRNLIFIICKIIFTYNYYNILIEQQLKASSFI